MVLICSMKLNSNKLLAQLQHSKAKVQIVIHLNWAHWILMYHNHSLPCVHDIIHEDALLQPIAERHLYDIMRSAIHEGHALWSIFDTHVSNEDATCQQVLER